jgi:hypothetical protein
MGITLITPTGDRPRAFALCEKYIARQSYKKQDIQWIVVDDGVCPTNITQGQTYIRPTLLWSGKNTQASNLLKALDFVENDLIFIIEDDDWYSPYYLEYYIKVIQTGQYDIFGCEKFYSYFLKTFQYYEYKHSLYSSLSQTAFSSKLLPHFRDTLEKINSKIQSNAPFSETFIDVTFWKNITNKYLMKNGLCASIKQFDNKIRDNITNRPINSKYIKLSQDNQNLSMLKYWIGSDYSNYLDK